MYGLSRELTLRQLELEPADCALLIDLAQHEMTFCRFQEAEAAMDHVERICTSGARKWIVARRVFLSERRGYPEASLRYHLDAQELCPDDATFLIYAACAVFKAGNTELAIEYATRATRCPLGCIEEAYFNLGGFLLAMRRFSEARVCYLKALEIDPDYDIARTRLEDVSRVLALEAMSTPPATDDELKALCNEADELGLAGLSRELTRRRLELDPDDFVRLIVMACHELTFCRYVEAKTATDHAERVCPPWGASQLLTQRGMLSEATGAPDASLRYHLAAHAAEPDKANFLINAADVAFNTGDTERAIEYAMRATRCPEGSIIDAHLNLGHYLLAIRRFPEARHWYFKALEIDPDCGDAWARLDEISRILALDTERGG
jgi:tetratricopeptide (TPR) repeat protein